VLRRKGHNPGFDVSEVKPPNVKLPIVKLPNVKLSIVKQRNVKLPIDSRGRSLVEARPTG
jgi:hypothetical protein